MRLATAVLASFLTLLLAGVVLAGGAVEAGETSGPGAADAEKEGTPASVEVAALFEAIRRLTFPVNRELARLDPPSAGHNNAPVIAIGSFFAPVDSLTIPSQAVHWDDPRVYAALREASVEALAMDGDGEKTELDSLIFKAQEREVHHGGPGHTEGRRASCLYC